MYSIIGIITRVESIIFVLVFLVFFRFGFGRRFERRLGCLLFFVFLEVFRGELDVDWIEEVSFELDELIVFVMIEVG